MKTVLKILIPVTVLILLLFFWALRPSPDLDIGNEEASVRITAKELYSDFFLDEQTANRNYAGKVLEISGVVTAVEQENLGKFQVKLKTENEMGQVICRLNTSNPDSVEDMKTGEEIIVKGQCVGFLFDLIIEPAMLITH